MACLILSTNSFELNDVAAIKYDPVPFDQIPVAMINSDSQKYELNAYFSIDYGDEPVISKNTNIKPVDDLQLGEEFNGSNLSLMCDSNDRCGTSLAPTAAKIYLVDKNITDEDIANNSFPVLELVNNDCGAQSIEDCAKLNFMIPLDILHRDYNIVIDLSFDEARWIYINPIKIRE